MVNNAFLHPVLDYGLKRHGAIDALQSSAQLVVALVATALADARCFYLSILLKAENSCFVSMRFTQKLPMFQASPRGGSHKAI